MQHLQTCLEVLQGVSINNFDECVRPMCCNWNTLIEFDECVSTNVLQPIKTVARMCFQCLEVLQGVSINNFDKCVLTNVLQLEHINQKPINTAPVPAAI